MDKATTEMHAGETLVIGCGPSAFRVEGHAPFEVVTINDAIRLVDHADFAAFNDMSALTRLDAEQVAKIQTFILPRFVHGALNDKLKVTDLIYWSDALDV